MYGKGNEAQSILRGALVFIHQDRLWIGGALMKFSRSRIAGGRVIVKPKGGLLLVLKKKIDTN
jgi:hypothetical protein